MKTMGSKETLKVGPLLSDLAPAAIHYLRRGACTSSDFASRQARGDGSSALQRREKRF